MFLHECEVLNYCWEALHVNWTCGLAGVSLGPSCYQPAFSLGTSSGWCLKIFFSGVHRLFFSGGGTCSLLLGEMVSDVYAWLLTSWSWIREGGFRSQCSVLISLQPVAISWAVSSLGALNISGSMSTENPPYLIGMVVVWCFGFADFHLIPLILVWRSPALEFSRLCRLSWFVPYWYPMSCAPQTFRIGLPSLWVVSHPSISFYICIYC